jgi:hypothetical protein
VLARMARRACALGADPVPQRDSAVEEGQKKVAEAKRRMDQLAAAQEVEQMRAETLRNAAVRARSLARHCHRVLIARRRAPVRAVRQRRDGPEGARPRQAGPGQRGARGARQGRRGGGEGQGSGRRRGAGQDHAGADGEGEGAGHRGPGAPQQRGGGARKGGRAPQEARRRVQRLRGACRAAPFGDDTRTDALYARCRCPRWATCGTPSLASTAPICSSTRTASPRLRASRRSRPTCVALRGARRSARVTRD